MEYLLKVSAVVAIFYLSYKVFLQRNTFFEQNRWFLLLGLATAFLIPFFVIPIYIEYTPVEMLPYYSFSDLPVAIQETQVDFNMLDYLPIIYLLGVVCFSVRFLMQFVSLSVVIYRNKKEKHGPYTHVKTNKNTSPFSFFNWIVYNPENFTDTELEQIITHEKVHANQKHSLDILLTQLSCILLWFNPFIWLYNKDLKQNLEFIADHETQRKFNCKKSYQTTLLKTSMPSHQIALTNNFYTSLIKKRIVMLHKSKSRKIHLIKYAFVIPLLAAFLMSFNTEEVYIEKQNQDVLKESIKDKIDTFLIQNTFTDNQLQTFKNDLKSKGFDFNLKSIKRNSDKLITSIDFIVAKNDAEGTYRIGSPKPLNTVVIEYHNSNNKFIINTSDFIESKRTINEDEDVIKITIDKNTTANSLEEQKEILKEKYNVDIDFKINNDQAKTYTFQIANGKHSQKITTQSDRPHVFIYNPITSLLTSYTINKNGDPEYGRENYLDKRSSIIITQDYSDESIEKFSKKLKEKGVNAKFTDIKRNNKGKIIGISISANSNEGNVINYNQNGDKPIDPIAISYYGDGHGVKIGPSSIYSYFKRKNKSSNQKKNDTLKNGWKTKFNNQKAKTTIKYFNYSEEDLKYSLTRFKKDETIVRFTNIKSNDEGDIIAATINTNSKDGLSTNYIYEFETPIKQASISYYIDVNNFKTEPRKVVVRRKTGKVLNDSTSKNLNSTNDNFLISEDEMKNLLSKDDITVIKENANYLKTLYRKNPLVLLDGKEVTLNEISSDNVHSITVLKDKSATDVFGDKGKDGVILITTKEKDIIKVKALKTKKGKEPLYIVDEKEFNEKNIEDLNPNDIERINVLKGEKAIEKYGDKGKDGVVEITTKKK